MYDLRARQYDPAIGRFVNIDPLTDEDEQLDKSNYAYAWDDPVKYNDPDGECPECIGGAVAGILDIAFQSIDIALDDHKTFSKDFSYVSVGIAVVAGATGVGVAAKVSKYVEVAGLGTKLLGNVIKRAVDGGVSATASAIQQKAVNGKIDGLKVAIDGAAGIIGGHIGDKAEASALKTAEGRVLKNQAGRASRMATGSRASRVTANAVAQKKLADFTRTRAAATAVGASGVAGNTVKEFQDKTNKK